jgi:phospholipase C
MTIADFVADRRVAYALTGALAGAVIAGCSAPSTSLQSPTVLPQPGSGSSPIQHVVIVIQENRSFDNLFDCFKGTACVKKGKEKVLEGTQYVDKSVTLEEQKLVPTMNNNDVGHCYYSFFTAWDNGAMDGFNLEPQGACSRKWGGTSGGGPIGTFPYQFIEHKEITAYWDMAEQYVLADRMFQTQGSGSFTAHQDLIRGGTAVAGQYGSSGSMIDTPNNDPWGCDASSKTVTDFITLSLKWEYDSGPFPCTSAFPSSGSGYETMRDLLDAQGISWKYYSPCFADSGTPGCKGNKCIVCIGAQLNAFDVIASVRHGSEWGTNVSMPQTNILTDIQKNQLAAVSWVIPDQNDSDHPGDATDHGPEWVASVVNAIGESPYWGSTAIVVLWDDWGGMYDHVPPAAIGSGSGRDDQGGLGFRVPMIVISPYAPQGVVSHTQYEFGSVLKYIEDNWNLGSLNTTDQRAASIGNTLNYNQQPRSFTPIPTQLSIDFFMHEKPSRFPADPE